MNDEPAATVGGSAAGATPYKSATSFWHLDVDAQRFDAFTTIDPGARAVASPRNAEFRGRCFGRGRPDTAWREPRALIERLRTRRNNARLLRTR
jgi:hypothetical protein